MALRALSETNCLHGAQRFLGSVTAALPSAQCHAQQKKKQCDAWARVTLDLHLVPFSALFYSGPTVHDTNRNPISLFVVDFPRLLGLF